jgi:hypothetical protein
MGSTLPVGALLLAAACAGAPGRQSESGDTLTTRERQERIQAMPIPGARGVGRALQVQDSGAARARLIDSVAQER